MFDTLLLCLVALPFLQGLLLFNARVLPRSSLGLLSSLFALCHMGIVLVLTRHFVTEGPATLSYTWAPLAMANFSLRADGLALFFALLITGMGTLVFLYAQCYMNHSHDRIRRFYSYLNIFMGAMLGAVLANNLILFFLFWELTGITSYLLISYRHEDSDARLGSRSAFLLNALAAVGLLGAIVLMGILDGTLEWSEIAAKGLIRQNHPFWIFVIMAMLLLAVGAKSAQFPLHFWLPGAMVAPTPVSAYLHSATMVKLGIYLVARSYILFVSSTIWFPVVTAFSIGTVIAGGICALFSPSLKQTLAYATISQLGFFISFYGIGYPEGLEYDYVHIFNHALYKGSLFMLAGVLFRTAGVTELSELPGLARQMPLFSAVYALSLAAMAGIPGTTGFLSKELLVRELVMVVYQEPIGGIVFTVLVLGLVIKVAFSYRLFHYFFLEPAKKVAKVQFEHYRFGLLFSPLVLSSAALLLGIWPMGIDTLSKIYAVEGLHSYREEQLALWHGLTIDLLISVLIFAGGFFLFRWTYWREKRYELLSESEVGRYWHCWLDTLPHVASRLTARVHHRLAEVNLRWILVFAALFAAFGLAPYLTKLQLPHALSIRDITSLLLVVSALALLCVRGILGQVLALSLMGFLVTLYFALWGAVDLAITQMVVEVVVVFSIVLVCLKGSQEEHVRFSWIRSLLALTFGLPLAAVPFLRGAILSGDDLGKFYLEQAQPLAKGANVVNTILVDFRALDTLGEIAVIVAVALGVSALLAPGTRWVRPLFHGLVPTPALTAVSPVILAVAAPFSLYLLLRGHDAPGGGFAGGMVLATAIVLRVISLPAQKKHWLQRIPPLPIALVGLLIAVAASLAPLATNGEFFQAYFHPATALVSTPVLFDLGIYLLILGATCTVIEAVRNRAIKGVSS